MLLNSDEIKNRNLILNPLSEKNFRAASYDISIGRIININGEELNSLKLKPQGIVEVLSHEKVKLPSNISGYALVKTSLCNEGILPLNTGIIDPGYEGYVSAMLLNFSKNDYLLSEGDVFLRLTFHECLPSQKASNNIQVKTEQEYIKDSKRKVLNFSDTFLNLEFAIQQITDKIFLRYTGGVIAISAIILALYPFIVTLALDYLNHNSTSKEQMETEITQKIREEKQSLMESRIKQLEEQISQMKAQQLPPNNTNNSKNNTDTSR